jgi:hypothetical protein
MVAIALGMELIEGLMTGAVVAFALVPVWWAATRQFVGARVLLVMAVVAIVSGLWLAEFSAASHVVSGLDQRAITFTVLGGFATTGVILWARTVLPLRVLALAYGVGLVLHLGLYPPNPVNPWKHGISFTLAVLLLALAEKGRPRAVEILALLALGAASALNDSRSSFATLVLAAVLVLWQMRPAAMSRRATGFSTIVMLGAVSVCVYTVGTSLIVDGYLGEATQQRSIEQIEASGSILLGGRPEWGASIALLGHQPWGFGTGVKANLEDILVAKSGMAALNYDPDNGYVENYMFGGPIKLHAVVADFWATFGIPGLVLAFTILGLTLWSLATSVAARTASGLVIYVTCLTLWNFAFGPIQTSMPSLALTLGLVLVRRTAPRTTSAAPVAAPAPTPALPPAPTRGRP